MWLMMLTCQSCGCLYGTSHLTFKVVLDMSKADRGDKDCVTINRKVKVPPTAALGGVRNRAA